MGERINIHAHTYIYTHVYTHIFGIFLTPQRDTSCSFLSSNLYSPSLLSKSSNQHSDFHHHSLLSPILKFHIIELYSVYAFVASFFHSSKSSALPGSRDGTQTYLQTWPLLNRTQNGLAQLVLGAEPAGCVCARAPPFPGGRGACPSARKHALQNSVACL